MVLTCSVYAGTAQGIFAQAPLRTLGLVCKYRRTCLAIHWLQAALCFPYQCSTTLATPPKGNSRDISLFAIVKTFILTFHMSISSVLLDFVTCVTGKTGAGICPLGSASLGLLYKISWNDFKAANDTSLLLLSAAFSMNSRSSDHAREKSPSSCSSCRLVLNTRETPDSVRTCVSAHCFCAVFLE